MLADRFIVRVACVAVASFRRARRRVKACISGDAKRGGSEGVPTASQGIVRVMLSGRLLCIGDPRFLWQLYTVVRLNFDRLKRRVALFHPA